MPMYTSAQHSTSCQVRTVTVTKQREDDQTPKSDPSQTGLTYVLSCFPSFISSLTSLYLLTVDVKGYYCA